MANATDIVKKGVVRWTDEFRQHSSATLAAATRFYRHAGLGLTTGGYLAKFDDTQSLIFQGVVRGNQDSNGGVLLPVGTAGDNALALDFQTPRFIELAISGFAVTDIGKTVYALDDQTGTLTSSSTTYGNVWGRAVGLVYDMSGAVVSSMALVELNYDGVAGHAALGAVKWLAATGAQTLTKWDIGKTIFLPNTAAYTVTLPAVASANVGGFLQFAKTTTDAEIVTLDGADSENIDAATTLTTIDAAYDCAKLVNTGVRWIITARDIA